MNFLKDSVKNFLAARGYQLAKIYGPDMKPDFIRIQKEISEYTMTSLERQFALFNAVNYLVDEKIEGDIVECGVWRGGSTMLIAEALKAKGDTGRSIYLYDTYTGMTQPTEKDVNLVNGKVALEKWKRLQKEDINEWDYASLEEVQSNMRKTGYPESKLKFIKGKVEETIPANMPEKIALLRVDTDWYESIMHSYQHLFPRLVKGGVLLLDDYGNWKGAQQATDEYFEKHGIKMLLNRIDYAGRIGIKLD